MRRRRARSGRRGARQGFPGGQLATVLGVIGEAISAALSFGGVIPLDVGKSLTAADAVIAALGKSPFGWKDDSAPRYPANSINSGPHESPRRARVGVRPRTPEVVALQN